MGRRRSLALLLLLALTWIVDILHLGVFPAPPAAQLLARPEVVARSRLLPRATAGINHLLLFGTPFERGLAAGRLTRDLLAQEEALLVGEMNRFFPNPVARWALLLGAMRWFSGIDRYFYPWTVEEMAGVARSSPPEFDYLADPFTRQIAYHGVHEIGQMFVDFEKQDFGCTVLGVRYNGGWLVGRNFDFEAVRLLDTEKIAKWVFPEPAAAGGGHAYLSVTWAGMVGAVTGVNDRGVYVSINAAGSADFRRYGTPTTLVALRALQEADDAAAAVRIIEEAPVFISDLFVVADARGALVVVEKTPRRVRSTAMTASAVVTNHLPSAEFRADAINGFRMREQTSVARYERGRELVDAWDVARLRTPFEAADAMAMLLRDKRGRGGLALTPGHRSAIDALIATHSVIYDAPDQAFWISQGPALTGPYLGYDLTRSFRERTPVAIGVLPADRAVAPAAFYRFKAAMATLRQARIDLKARDCPAADAALRQVAASPANGHYDYLIARGDYYESCGHDRSEARGYWRRALAAAPAYLKDQHRLQEALR